MLGPRERKGILGAFEVYYTVLAQRRGMTKAEVAMKVPDTPSPLLAKTVSSQKQGKCPTCGGKHKPEVELLESLASRCKERKVMSGRLQQIGYEKRRARMSEQIRISRTQTGGPQ